MQALSPASVGSLGHSTWAGEQGVGKGTREPQWKPSPRSTLPTAVPSCFLLALGSLALPSPLPSGCLALLALSSSL